MSAEVRQVTLADLDLVAPLFDTYRQFYRQPTDLASARRFLQARFENGESTIFLAFLPDGSPAGFTQLYPSFSSVSMARIYVLNDLFVAPDARRAQVGSRLLAASAEFARAAGAVRIQLSTELTNHAAQALYEREGWVRDTRFCSYNLALVP